MVLLVFGPCDGLGRHRTVRHSVPGPARRRGRVAEQGVRLLAPDGRVATGDVAGIAVARTGWTVAEDDVRATPLEAAQTVLRRSTGQLAEQKSRCTIRRRSSRDTVRIID